MVLADPIYIIISLDPTTQNLRDQGISQRGLVGSSGSLRTVLVIASSLPVMTDRCGRETDGPQGQGTQEDGGARRASGVHPKAGGEGRACKSL